MFSEIGLLYFILLTSVIGLIPCIMNRNGFIEATLSNDDKLDVLLLCAQSICLGISVAIAYYLITNSQ